MSLVLMPQGKLNLSNGSGNSSLQIKGSGAIANQQYQTVIGKYNNNKEDTLFEVGNGTDNNNRSNALEVNKDGSIKSGRSTISTDTNTTLVTKDYVDSSISNALGDLNESLIDLDIGSGVQ